VAGGDLAERQLGDVGLCAADVELGDDVGNVHSTPPADGVEKGRFPRRVRIGVGELQTSGRPFGSTRCGLGQ
jgi:hypothetical protein